jgi:uncharacterized protein
MVSARRRREVERLLDHATEWAASRGDIRALALVGSWGRGDPREDSDVDLVVLTDGPGAFTHRDDWVGELAPGAAVVRSGEWGVIAERRLRLPSGLEIEVGIGFPSWAATDPMDAGTRRVLEAGFRPLYDPWRLLRNLEVAAPDQERRGQ